MGNMTAAVLLKLLINGNEKQMTLAIKSENLNCYYVTLLKFLHAIRV